MNANAIDPGGPCARLDRSLCQISRYLQHEVQRFHREEGLTPAQALLLNMLGEDGASSVSQVARNLSVSCSAVTLLAHRLQAEGLVARVRQEQDRRVVLLMLTPVGSEMLERIVTKRRLTVEQLLVDLSSEDVEALVASVARLVTGT